MHCILWLLGDYYFFYLVKTLAGRRCAILATIVSFANDDVFRFVSRVSSNGVEGSLVIAAMYYYIKIKPEIFDKNLSKMTLMITLCFIARSSSLVPWIPLAILKILENYQFFVPIVVSGLIVTIPMCIISILVDSFFYGVLTIPQVNFVNFNVVENISKYFGIAPGYFYIEGLRHQYCDPLLVPGLFGLSLLTIQQLFGGLEYYNSACATAKCQATKIPFVFVYSITYVLVLSSLDHKELRFYTPII